MASGAVLAAALQGTGAHPLGLYVGGLDVVGLTDIDSVRVTEEGAGAVSSMEFVIDDPTGVVGVPVGGEEVRLMDLTLNYPIFAGYLDSYAVVPFGVGRTIKITALGFEALLDWQIIPAVQLSGTDINPEFLCVEIAQLVNDYALDARLYAPPSTPGVDPANGDATHPIGTLFDAANATTWSAGRDVGPGTLRAVISQAVKQGQVGGTHFGGPAPSAVAITVDFWRRLRVFYADAAPNDYTGLTVVDTYASTLNATVPVYEAHPGETIRAVYVVGANAAGTGWVTDGSGITGPKAIVNAPLADTAERMAQVGTLYLQANAGDVRGTLTLDDYVPTVGTVHPGSTITLTDAQLGVSARSFAIASITKRFTAGGDRQTWDIAFGARRPSYIEQIARDYSKDATWTNTELRGANNG